MNQTALIEDNAMKNRRDFISLAGKSLGLAALSIPSISALLKDVEAASRNVAHLSAEQVAMDEDYWFVIQNAFTVTRGIVNLNNGGVSPSPRIVTEALVRYIWQQEDATAYTMWPSPPRRLAQTRPSATAPASLSRAPCAASTSRMKRRSSWWVTVILSPLTRCLQCVARMSEATCGMKPRGSSRISLRSSGLHFAYFVAGKNASSHCRSM